MREWLIPQTITGTERLLAVIANSNEPLRLRAAPCFNIARQGIITRSAFLIMLEECLSGIMRWIGEQLIFEL